jgi:hypothetical protein
MNEALRYINQSYALQNADFLEEIQQYHLNDMNAAIDIWNATNPSNQKDHVDFSKGVDLPDDYLAIVSITRTDGYILHPCPAAMPPMRGQYKIVGSKLYLFDDADLLYRRSLSAVATDDSIDLPTFFLDPIAKVTGMILNNNPQTDVMMDEVNSVIASIVPARRYSNIKTPLQWKV